jgi:broad specificity phosphatase PhoE
MHEERPQSLATEVLNPPPTLDVILARHAAYHQPTGDDVSTEVVGALTPEGIAQSRELGRQVFQKATETGKPTDILFISSPTAYDEMAGYHARRAEQTADVAMAAILEMAQILPEDQVRLLGPVPKDKPESPYHRRLVEPNIHYIPTADNPRAYLEKQVEKFGIRSDEGTGAIGRKEGYARGDAEVDEVALQIGAETAQEVGIRAYSVVRDMKQLAEVHAEVRPDRNFLVILVTHDDVMRSVAQNIMGAGGEAHGYFPGNTETLPLHIEGNNAQLEFKGKVYNRDI